MNILQPLIDQLSIQKRLDCVEVLRRERGILQQITEELSEITFDVDSLVFALVIVRKR